MFFLLRAAPPRPPLPRLARLVSLANRASTRQRVSVVAETHFPGSLIRHASVSATFTPVPRPSIRGLEPAPASKTDERTSLATPLLSKMSEIVTRSRANPIDFLHVAHSLPPMREWSDADLVSVATTLPLVPLALRDERVEWSEAVSVALDLAAADLPEMSAAAATRDTATIPDHLIDVLSGLARAIARRKLAAGRPVFDALHAQMAVIHDPKHSAPDQKKTRAQSGLDVAVMLMYRHLGDSAGALQYFNNHLPEPQWTAYTVGVAASALSVLYRPADIAALMSRAVALNLAPGRWDQTAVNIAYLESFTGAAQTMQAFEAMVAERAGVASHKPPVPRPRRDYQNDQYEHDPLFNRSVLTTLLRKFSRESNVAGADHVLAQFEARAPVPVQWEPDTVVALTTLYGATGNRRRALAVFWVAQLPPRNVPVTTRMLAHAIQVAGTCASNSSGDREAAAKDVDRVHALALDLAGHRRISLSSMYATLAVKAFGSVCGVDRAHAAYDELRRRGMPRSRLCEEHLAWLDANNTTKYNGAKFVDRTVSSPRQQQPQIKRSAFEDARDQQVMAEVALTKAVQQLLANGAVVDALKQWRTAAESRPAGVSGPYLLLLNHFAARGDPNSVARIERLAAGLNIQLSPTAVRSLPSIRIKAYSLARDWPRVFAVWDTDLVARGIAPDVPEQALVLDACGYAGDRARLNRIVRLLAAEPWGGTDVNVWTSAVEAFCRIGDLDAAVDVVRRIVPAKRLRPDEPKLLGTLVTVEHEANQPLKHPGVVALLTEYRVDQMMARDRKYGFAVEVAVSHWRRSGKVA
ncbi:hypothetical protein BC828DRAFT_385352 [Blastocladiella britannica]|nr:hypothetical protein BC828DRAFT_385352 [Blastocladiella britannica]